MKLGTWLAQIFFPRHWHRHYNYHLGGAPFYYLYGDLPNLNLFRMLNTLGIFLIFFTTLLGCLLYLAKISPKTLLQGLSLIGSKIRSTIRFKERIQNLIKRPSQKPSNFSRFVKVKTASTPSRREEHSPEMLEITPEVNLKERPSISRKERIPSPIHIPETPSSPPIKQPKPKPQTRRELALSQQAVFNGDFREYKIPNKSLLTEPKKINQAALKKSLQRQAEVLEETLHSFGIDAKVGQINCGPTITSFEVHPAIGVKVQKVKALSNDIALNMEAASIRILAPIPGKAAIGIEVPNPEPQEVGFKDILNAYQQGKKKFFIPVLLGKTVSGEYVMNDLSKMPHCIIAGATGSGKSVCINTIVMSILLNAKPDEVKLIMVDPKKVELTPYTKLPHMLAPVITEPNGACIALKWLVKEMEKRYELLKKIGVRNIAAFNTRSIDKDFEESLGCEIPEKMYYIVTIIDELADLMMVASNDIETPIARIAQMARAVGIHLILATQRPSREVITGIIKANFPTRISFKVSSRINSQIILDETGAESLLGNGDMLFLPIGSSHLQRAQGAYIRDEDINAIVKEICNQAPPSYIIESFDEMHDLMPGNSAADETPNDSMYEDAYDMVTATGNASTTFLQRKLKIGYARAASLMDELEARGIVSKADGSKPRKVLVAKAEDEDEIALTE